VAHNTGGCTPERHYCTVGGAAAHCHPTNPNMFCLVTTGNAGFCADFTGSSNEANCRPCARDKDCEALGFGAGAACVILRTEGVCVTGCESVNGSSGTACLPPGA